MDNMIYKYVNKPTFYYTIVLIFFLLFLYVVYTTQLTTQMNVMEGLTKEKKEKRS